MNSPKQIAISSFSIGDEGTDALKYKIPVSDISFGNPGDPEYAVLRISVPQITETTEETIKQGLWKLGVDKNSVQDTRLAVNFTIATNGEIIRFPSCISRVCAGNSEVKLTAYIYQTSNGKKWWVEVNGKKLTANEYDLPFLTNE